MSKSTKMSSSEKPGTVSRLHAGHGAQARQLSSSERQNPGGSAHACSENGRRQWKKPQLSLFNEKGCKQKAVSFLPVCRKGVEAVPVLKVQKLEITEKQVRGQPCKLRLASASSSQPRTSCPGTTPKWESLPLKPENEMFKVRGHGRGKLRPCLRAGKGTGREVLCLPENSDPE